MIGCDFDGLIDMEGRAGVSFVRRKYLLEGLVSLVRFYRIKVLF